MGQKQMGSSQSGFLLLILETNQLPYYSLNLSHLIWMFAAAAVCKLARRLAMAAKTESQ
ncbi:hypothetical protein BO86DRAFT_385289 [Aspergillus japonicus CBS 114.51]|uniref:Uncharacterized protein n=1 Tax=Aspergillus japonicus CBS 114.51 TaxID=1448312 RepID=A0A8T8XEP3_ASPJA|nr:hypothetical protein BO86DRAFT_385289 [Aspergillus japonicus CBS 114.51]RAH86438.1 hypothetical protein BO86DRAFT_385289 [Aspergillus japonicus CBS 114.51]